MAMRVLRKGKYSAGVRPEERSIKELFGCGVALIDKPRGPSSHEVSSFTRKILGVSKTGHSGTLDPNVSGVLPVLLNNACKAAPLLLASPKRYVCVMSIEGGVEKKELEECVKLFTGKIYQTPPIQSAVKKALRVREVKSLKLLEVGGSLALFDAKVQSGTYIRTLVRDIGLVMGKKTSMDELRRTEAAGVKEEQCVTLQELSDRYWLSVKRGEDAPLRQCVLPVERVAKLRKIVVPDALLKPLSTGANLGTGGVDALDDSIKAGHHVGIYSGKGELVCIAKAMLDAASAIEHSGRDEKDELFADVVRVVNARA